MKEKNIPTIKELHAPIDFYGKCFIVKTIAKEDLTEYMSAIEISALRDEDMSYIASKMGDLLQDNYWEALEAVLDEFEPTNPETE